jgi:sterol desaturase/sphingolipid hydroxylase (fatty acid hydroxylase superfamily)
VNLLQTPPRVDPGTMSRQEYLKASPPMFGPAWMDRLTRVHPAVVPAIFVPAIVVFALLALRDLAWWQTLLLLGAGYVVWTLTEYWLHRIVFHFEPEHPVGARLHWMIHGVHHDHPNDPMRLVMPPSASLPLAAFFALLFQALLPFAEACALSAGFFAGYLAYDMLHYYVHHRRPRGPIGRRLRELHMRHHFQDHQRGYGVSAPWWDTVFGTATRDRRES